MGPLLSFCCRIIFSLLSRLSIWIVSILIGEMQSQKCRKPDNKENSWMKQKNVVCILPRSSKLTSGFRQPVSSSVKLKMSKKACFTGCMQTMHCNAMNMFDKVYFMKGKQHIKPSGLGGAVKPGEKRVTYCASNKGVCRAAPGFARYRPFIYMVIFNKEQIRRLYP